jgi:hypothetical protein
MNKTQNQNQHQHNHQHHHRLVLSWVQDVLGGSTEETSADFWDEEPEWHQDFVATELAKNVDL